MSRHIMVDIETLSTRPDAAITQIAAAEFVPLPEPPFAEVPLAIRTFNAHVDFDLDDSRFHVSKSTLLWWIGQSTEARERFIDGQSDALRIRSTLVHLNGWWPSGETKIWSHGAAFDIAILHHAFDVCAIRAPWHYRSVRDTRTLFDLAFGPQGDVPEPPPSPDHVAHDALCDVHRQIWQVQEAYRALAAKGVR